MNTGAKSVLACTVIILAVGAAEARGPSPRPWLIYPSKSMDMCRAGTAPQSYAARCGDLLYAYARELEACVAMRRGGPVLAEMQISVQIAAPDCAKTAARLAAASVQ